MRSKAVVLLVAVAAALSAQQWQLAVPGYHYEFPRDHFSHPDYQTEWWYYTGNLKTPDGHRFGFEVTFFREGIRLSKQQAAESNATWRPDQVYLAHLALSDIDGQEFFHTERLNRAGPGLAGSSLVQQRYWNGNWQVHWLSLTSGEQELQAVCDRFTLHLKLKPGKPLVIHGRDGVSEKGPLPGEASHYISFTRLSVAGELSGWKGRSYSLTGLAWMDHEFFSQTADETLTGWDWFSIQLNNNEELMLYRLRKKSGEWDAFSSGTYVDRQGHAHFLGASDFSLTPGETWRSSASGARYPVAWKIAIPCLQLELSEQSLLNDQELFTKDGVTPTYWEGAVAYAGHIHSQSVQGVGYLEMTGYASALAGDTAQK
ncbi:MAG TPA: lipocalin-like domain-containing protein [Bryobacteraceae bacterium]|nr:lipocalin-like domain-containing protein [Bryobacteraceae bacterium]